MPSTYTLNNGIELVATGEQSGTWGDTTNTNFTLLDTSLDGQVTVTLGATGSSGSPNALPVSDGATSNGRNRLIIFADSGDLGGTAFVQLTPNDAEKIIYVRNNLSGSRSILLFQGTYNASNDYEVPAGTTAVVFFNGAGSGAVAANVFNNAHFDALNVVGTVTITETGNNNTLTLASTDADANAGPNLLMFRDSASPADSDRLATITYRGKNDAAQNVDYIVYDSFISDASDGSEDATLDIRTILAGSEVSRIALTPTETVINESSNDVNFRVESDGNANMLFVDGGNDAVLIAHNEGIAVAGQQHELQVYDTNFSVASLATFRNGSDGATLSLAHSRSGTIGTQTVLNNADIMGAFNFIGSDGTDMATVGAAIRAHVDGTPGSNDMPGRLVFLTTADGAASSTERMRINKDGNISIGTGADAGTVRLNMAYSHATQYGIKLMNTNTTITAKSGITMPVSNGTGGGAIYVDSAVSSGNGNAYNMHLETFQGASNIVFEPTGTEAMRIDSSQRVLVGRTSAFTNIQSIAEGSNTPVLLQIGTDGSGESAAAFINNHNSNAGFGGNLTLGREMSTGNVIVNGMQMGAIHFNGHDGTNIVQGAAIQAYVDGAATGGDMPTRIAFYTAPDGTDAISERMRVNARGDVYTAANSTLSANMMNMYGGTISIPGNSTRYVTFNGANLSGGSGVAEVTIGFYGSAGTGTGGLKVIDAGHWGGTVYHQATEMYRFSGNLTVNAITETSGGWKAQVVNGVAQSATGFYMIHANVGTQSQDMTDIVTVETS